MIIAKKLGTIVTAVATLVAIIVGALDLAGALDGVGWLRDRISVLTLLVVGAVAAYLVVEQSFADRNQSDIVRSAVDQAVAALSGIESRKFDNRADFWLYAAKRIRESKSIDDLTWGKVVPTTMTPLDKKSYTEYRREIQGASTGKGANRSKLYREIMSFPSDIRLGRAAPLLNNEKYPNYQLRCYRYDHSGTPPLLQFFVFDKTETLVSLTPITGSASDSRYMTFKSRQLADLMSDYFEAAWREAIVLKDYSAIEWPILRDIADQLGSHVFDSVDSQDYRRRDAP